MKLTFFGSFQHYSTIILDSLIRAKNIEVTSVVTTPPMPSGPKKLIKRTHTHFYALKNKLPVFHPHKLTPIELSKLPSSDIFLTAGYGKLIPSTWIKHPNTAALNIHFSLLPKFRGANPAEWAILLNESITGITLIEMDSKFDTGSIIDKKELRITPADTRLTLYKKLYSLAAKAAPQML